MNNDDRWGNGEIDGKGLSRVARNSFSVMSLLYFPSLPIHGTWYCSNGNPRLPQKQGCCQRPALCSIGSSHMHLKNVRILPHPRSTCCMSLILARTHINNSTQWPDCWLAACVWMSCRWKTVRPKPQLPLRGNKINCHDRRYVTPAFSLLLLSDLP